MVDSTGEFDGLLYAQNIQDIKHPAHPLLTPSMRLGQRIVQRSFQFTANPCRARITTTNENGTDGSKMSNLSTSFGCAIWKSSVPIGLARLSKPVSGYVFSLGMD